MIWDPIVDFLRLMIFAHAQIWGGNLGAGILTTSLLLRAALFPVTLRIARANQLHQQAMQQVKPELDRIREEFKESPQQIAEASNRVFAEHGISPVPWSSCLGSLAQMPLFVALYAAVGKVAAMGGRFLWIGNIARPDLMLTGIVAAITFGSISLSSSNSPHVEGRQLLLALPLIVTVVVLLKTSAGIALYWGVSAAASCLQAYLIRRTADGLAT